MKTSVFIFLEMNTRLQVEHPITELITGVDLVKEQINIAKGLPLSFKQEDLSINGHAIEVRVYAEDPSNNFVPDIGVLKTYKLPESNGIRVDNGFDEGMEIPIYYDSMISKLIAYADCREEATSKMKRAIAEYTIVGVKTTLLFADFVMKNEHFISGNFDTHFINHHFSSDDLTQSVEEEARVASILAKQIIEKKNDSHVGISTKKVKSVEGE